MKRLRLKKENIVKIGFIFSVFLFVLSASFKLYLCGSLAIKNSELEKAFTYQRSLEEKISELSFIDSGLSSISSIETRAKKLGFVEMSGRILSINPEAPVQVAALNQ